MLGPAPPGPAMLGPAPPGPAPPGPAMPGPAPPGPAMRGPAPPVPAVPGPAPARALLSAAHALLGPAHSLAASSPPAPPTLPAPPANLDELPIDGLTMPTEDVSDLKDVFDAINRLCETMRTSTYEEPDPEEEPVVEADDEIIDTISSNAVSIAETISTTDVEIADAVQVVECDAELVSPAEVSIRTIEAYRAERWSDALVSPPNDETDTLPSDTEPAAVTCEPASEMYYTASSEVSLMSDFELPERQPVDEDAVFEVKDKDEKKECVMSGHVAAMRERYESMTRTNTPCSDLDARNITPSPDLLG